MTEPARAARLIALRDHQEQEMHEEETDPRVDVKCDAPPTGSTAQTANGCAPSMTDAAEMLWIVLANVSGGDWTQQPPEWQEAAARWRDYYFHALTAAAPAPQDPPEDDAHALKEAKAILLGIGETGYAMTHPDGPHTSLGQAAAHAMGRSGYVELCVVEASSGGGQPPSLVVVLEVPSHLFKAGQEVTVTVEPEEGAGASGIPPPPPKKLEEKEQE